MVSQRRRGRKINFGSCDDIEVVRKDTQSDVGHDFGDRRIAIAGLANFGEIGIAHLATVIDDLARETEDRVDFRIDRFATTTVADLLRR